MNKLASISLAALLIVVVLRAQANDLSFYQEVDKNDWPGDTLSETQTLKAIKHFSDPDACRKPWRWALIGPNVFLLKGTTYLVERNMDAPVPNIGWSKGYWGGEPMFNTTVLAVKLRVQYIATEDCLYAGRK